MTGRPKGAVGKNNRVRLCITVTQEHYEWLKSERMPSARVIEEALEMHKSYRKFIQDKEIRDRVNQMFEEWKKNHG